MKDRRTKMRIYEIIDERGRINNFKYTTEDPCGEILKSHTYSTAYANAAGSGDIKQLEQILNGEKELTDDEARLIGGCY